MKNNKIHPSLYGINNITDLNKKQKDNGSKLIFGDHILCAQFIRDYLEIPMLKSVQPEDIEDVSERFVPLFTSDREADTVKRIRLKDENGEKTIFLISLIEHKTEVDYNVVMQLLRYMCYIWEDYEKEKLREYEQQKSPDASDSHQVNYVPEQQDNTESHTTSPQRTKTKTLISAHKDFKYPPILPIVYFEGSMEWTAVRNLKDRIYLSDIFDKYTPDFTYELIRLHDYSNDQLMEHEDEISLIMLLNKLQSLADLNGISEWKDFQSNVLKHTPAHLLDIIAKITTVLLTRLNLPSDEVDEFVSRIKEGNMPELFEHFERVDVPAMRRQIEKEREILRCERQGLQAEREGLQAEREVFEADRIIFKAEKAEFHTRMKVQNIYQLYANGCSFHTIEMATGDSEMTRTVCAIIESLGANCSIEAVLERIKQQSLL